MWCYSLILILFVNPSYQEVPYNQEIVDAILKLENVLGDMLSTQLGLKLAKVHQRFDDIDDVLMNTTKEIHKLNIKVKTLEKREWDRFDHTSLVTHTKQYFEPFDNIWSDEQCSNAGNFLGKTLSECMDQCDRTSSCNAINYSGSRPECVLRACSQPIPHPQGNNSDYKGYQQIIAPCPDYCTSTTCPSGYTKIESQCLAFRNDKELSWVDAQAECQKTGGRLLKPKDPNELATYIKANYAEQNFWLGATDVHKEGEWLWVSGGIVDPNIWYPGEPNNKLDGEDCMVWWRADRNGYIDEVCSRSYYFICEADLEKGLLENNYL